MSCLGQNLSRVYAYMILNEGIPISTYVFYVYHNSYSLQESHGDRFSVLPSSGEIVATRPLDREEQAMYNLVVIAKDQGIPPKSSSASVIVYVDDVNDNTPAFEQSSYSVTIADSSTSGKLTNIENDMKSVILFNLKSQIS